MAFIYLQTDFVCFRGKKMKKFHLCTAGVQTLHVIDEESAFEWNRALQSGEFMLFLYITGVLPFNSNTFIYILIIQHIGFFHHAFTKLCVFKISRYLTNDLIMFR